MTSQKVRRLSAPSLVLSIIDANGGEIEGRTKVQKIAYFLSKEGRYRVTFSPHYYGPFSADLDNALQTLVSFGLVEETVRTPGLVERENVVFEPKLYTYRITQEGKDVLSGTIRPEERELSRIRERIGKMKTIKGGFQTKTLSSAAKIDFILSRLNRQASYSEISKMAKQLGWSLSSAEIANVVGFLVEMGLASKS